MIYTNISRVVFVAAKTTRVETLCDRTETGDWKPGRGGRQRQAGDVRQHVQAHLPLPRHHGHEDDYQTGRPARGQRA